MRTLAKILKTLVWIAASVSIMREEFVFAGIFFLCVELINIVYLRKEKERTETDINKITS